MSAIYEAMREWWNTIQDKDNVGPNVAFRAGFEAGAKYAERHRKLKGLGGGTGRDKRKPTMAQQERSMK